RADKCALWQGGTCSARRLYPNDDRYFAGHQPKEGSAMSEVIQALLKCERVSFGSEDVAKLVAAFESAITELGLKDRNDPATTQVAKLIIQLAKDGHRDPKRLAERATGIVRGSN